jgi:lipid-binding SYLF domain-containing protein
MQEVLHIPDNLPQQVLAKAECVIGFPSVLRLGFGMGKEYGRGAMVCRTGKEFNELGVLPRGTLSQAIASECNSVAKLPI